MLKSGNVTIKDIAAVLHVSAKTVSSGLNGTGRISALMREKIQSTAIELGYVRNAAARALVTRNSGFIGVIVPYINNSFFSNILAGMEMTAGDRGHMILIDTFDRRDRGHQYQMMSRLMEHHVDGLIVYPAPEICENLELFRNFGGPVVQIMNRIPELGEHSVTVDNYGGALQAMEHLIRQGHRRIAFLGHDALSGELLERRRGYEDMMAKIGVSPVVEQCGLVSVVGGETAAAKLLEEHPEITAVFCASDFAGLGAVRAALHLGRRVPEDLAVIGFDNLEIGASQLSHPLTTIGQPQEKLGRCAVEMLLDLIGNTSRESMVLETSLMCRKTA